MPGCDANGWQNDCLCGISALFENAMMKTTFDQILQRQPQLFSNADLHLPSAAKAGMAEVIAACEVVIALPTYQAHALAQAPAICRVPMAARGVFMGYDFHLTDDGPRLIEINTNAGGGLLNAYLLAAHGQGAAGGGAGGVCGHVPRRVAAGAR